MLVDFLVLDYRGVEYARVVGLEKRGHGTSVASLDIRLEKRGGVGIDSRCELDSVEVALDEMQVLGTDEVRDAKILGDLALEVAVADASELVGVVVL